MLNIDRLTRARSKKLPTKGAISSLDRTKWSRANIFNKRGTRTIMQLNLPKLSGHPTAERDKLMMVLIIENVRTDGRPSTERPRMLLID